MFKKNNLRKKNFNKIKYAYWIDSFKKIFSSKYHHSVHEKESLIAKIPQLDTNTIVDNIAIILNNQVVDIIHCQPRLTEILLDDVKFVQIPTSIDVKPGWKYELDKFIEDDNHFHNNH